VERALLPAAFDFAFDFDRALSACIRANPWQIALPLLHSLLPVNLSRKLNEKIQQRSPPHLPRHSPPTLRKRVPRMRLPSRRNHPPAKRPSIQSQLRTPMLLTPVISHQIPDKRMPRPRPQPAALALVIAHFISQFRIPQSRQRVRRNKLSFPRRKPFRVSSPPIVPLRRRSAKLVIPRRKHSLHIGLRSRQRLPQIDLFPLLPRRTNQCPLPPHILSRYPSRLPIPRPPQPRRSCVPRHPGSFLHRISTLLFFPTLSRRIRKLFPRRLLLILTSLALTSLALRGLVLRGLLGLILRPPQSHRHRTHHHQHKASPTLCPLCPPC
jgi:hypothetical protein